MLFIKCDLILENYSKQYLDFLQKYSEYNNKYFKKNVFKKNNSFNQFQIMYLEYKLGTTWR